MAYSRDAVINGIMMTLIFIGGIGFVVILDIWNLRSSARDKRPLLARMSTQTKIALLISLTLIAAGAAAIFLLEKGYLMAGMGAKEAFLGSLFQSVTSRTAGFNTLPIDKFSPPTLMALIFLMFIGASPGSTGGGIKTCTFGVLVASVSAMIKNRESVWMFKKSIPRATVRKALSIVVLALGWIFLFSLLLSVTERGNIFGKDYYLRILFETTSAFGTVGLSTGITSMLTSAGKILIILTMFAGRIGPLTLALTLALQEDKLLYNYPEEEVMVG
jgi:trk system potassium uptake protein TrkH